MHIRRVFDDSRLHILAEAVYHDLLNGDANAIHRLSRYLVTSGLKADIRGTRVIAVSAYTRAKHPEQIIFDLRGGDPYAISGHAACSMVSAHYVAHYLDPEGSETLAQQEERYAVEARSPRPSDRTEAEDTMLRDRS